MAAAVCVISANKGIHEGLSALLTKQERVEGEALERWLQHVVVSGPLYCYGHVMLMCRDVMLKCLAGRSSACNKSRLS